MFSGLDVPVYTLLVRLITEPTLTESIDQWGIIEARPVDGALGRVCTGIDPFGDASRSPIVLLP